MTPWSITRVMLCGVACLVHAVLCSHDHPSSPTVTLTSGVVLGTTTSLPAATAPVDKYLGVPFAQSPPERFAPPKDPKPWSKPLTATSIKPACIQQWSYPEPGRSFFRDLWNNPGGPDPKESEDCLYLNIFAPSSSPPSGGRAVMVWWFGGALQWGDASGLWYDGSSFAAYQDVIIVSPNYRTNVFGFPSSPQIPLTQRNIGFLDVRKALAWVQANIRHFGGDPAKVTIFGWSAGAHIVDNLIATSPADPPFRAAIMESGEATYDGFFHPGDQVTARKAWDTLADKLGCSRKPDVLQCVRKADAFKIRDIIEREAVTFATAIDGVTQISDADAARAAGRVANVPLMLGNNAREGATATALGSNFSVAETVKAVFPNDTALQNEIIATYALGHEGRKTEADAVEQMFTDYFQTCVISYIAHRSASAGYPTWRYFLDAAFANLERSIPNGGAYHGTQVELVHGTYPRINATAQEAALSAFIQGAWADFAKNPQRGPGWNAVGTFDGVDLGVLGRDGGSGITVVDPREEVDRRCPLWYRLFARTHTFPMGS